jgi:translation initiation factor IF-2
VAGCYVIEGVVQRAARARLIRDGVVIHDGVIGSLKRFKDDVREVAAGFECGIGLENYNDIKEGDSIEAYLIREVART